MLVMTSWNLKLKESKNLLLLHSSGILVSPNHRGGSNPEPPDKVPENSFLLQYTYIHILYLKKWKQRDILIYNHYYQGDCNDIDAKQLRQYP